MLKLRDRPGLYRPAGGRPAHRLPARLAAAEPPRGCHRPPPGCLPQALGRGPSDHFHSLRIRTVSSQISSRWTSGTGRSDLAAAGFVNRWPGVRISPSAHSFRDQIGALAGLAGDPEEPDNRQRDSHELRKRRATVGFRRSHRSGGTSGRCHAIANRWRPAMASAPAQPSPAQAIRQR